MWENVWKFLILGDATAEQRTLATRFLVRTGYRIATTTAILWAFGVFGDVGFGDGFARAGDMDTKIATATRPLEKKIDEQGQILSAVARQVSEQVANSLASEIRYLVAKKCPEINPSERDRLQREIDRKQIEYRDIRNEFYRFGCDDV